MIDVSITVDTEFSIGGAFGSDTHTPLGPAERVDCRIGGCDWGLGRMLELLAEFDIRATFFVEALQSAFFGDAPMGHAVERILTAGHDVQLHLHPAWLAFRNPDWREAARHRIPCDSCAGRSVDELSDMIGYGQAVFGRWGAPFPVALRTGSLRVDRTVYRAAARMGLRLASNVGIAYFEPAEEELRLAAGLQSFDGVLEVPVVTYRQVALGPLRPLRLCTITSTSRWEVRALLDKADQVQISPFVILTHPFEFVRFFGERAPVSPSTINLRRLASLCAFLAGNRDRFRPTTFAEGAERWTALSERRFSPLGVPALATAARIVENKVNDLRLWS